MAPKKYASVIVPDADEGSWGVLSFFFGLFLLSTSMLFAAITAWLVQSLITYRACGWVFNTIDQIPRCLQ